MYNNNNFRDISRPSLFRHNVTYQKTCEVAALKDENKILTSNNL